jgi:hypothetical protein
MSAFATAVAAVLAAGLLGQPAPRPAPAGEVVRQAAEMTFGVWQVRQMADRSPHDANLAAAAAAARFDSLLASAAALASEQEAAAALAAEGESIEGKLFAIAVERARHPERFEEIRRTYVDAQPRPWQTQAAPAPAPAHATEAFRLAWELWLLAPSPPGAAPGYDETAAKAVAAIGNPASLVTLRHLARVAAAAPADNAAVAAQRLVIRTLAAMPGEPSARAFEEILDLAAAQRRTVGAGRVWDPRGYAAGVIAELPRTRLEAWRAALAPLVRSARRPTAAALLSAVEGTLKASEGH